MKKKILAVFIFFIFSSMVYAEQAYHAPSGIDNAPKISMEEDSHVIIDIARMSFWDNIIEGSQVVFYRKIMVDEEMFLVPIGKGTVVKIRWENAIVAPSFKEGYLPMTGDLALNASEWPVTVMQ